MNRRKISYLRKKDVTELKAAYLVLTEDEVSSPTYIYGVLRFLGHNVRRFKIFSPGSSPKSIQARAKLELQNYELIFCVFDKDTHDSRGGHYTKLVDWVATQDKVHGINSIPCIEYWFYLHFSYTDAPIEDGLKMEALLRTALPKYNKGAVQFSDFEKGLDNAIRGSEKSIARFDVDGGDNPMTRMAQFIEVVKALPLK